MPGIWDYKQMNMEPDLNGARQTLELKKDLRNGPPLVILQNILIHLPKIL